MNIFKKHKQKIIGLLFLLSTLYVIKYCFFTETEFVILNQMTKIDTLENSIDEIILVKNPPKTSHELEKLILLYNSKREIRYKNIDQLFIKEHDYILFPALFLNENYNYENFETKSDKLDNIDFLAKRHRGVNIDDEVFDRIYCHVSKYNYYKK